MCLGNMPSDLDEGTRPKGLNTIGSQARFALGSLLQNQRMLC